MSSRADGQAAYERYAGAVGWTAYNGETMKPWAQVPARIQNAWIETAHAIRERAEVAIRAEIKAEVEEEHGIRL